eukprot:CAMPEP_0179969452 /NCGR_PEP_ID=MMETSP0983-20121128/34591_1 /TAXON_ID=483367 /ORGANISM="non described non described, Strain CCMP 2436" /LENGTH=160 /DNA_ID=CAMNT_0021883689 /DNA_START=137 /DNA_END=617 /DNA_ORIENTATION=+
MREEFGQVYLHVDHRRVELVAVVEVGHVHHQSHHALRARAAGRALEARSFEDDAHTLGRTVVELRVRERGARDGAVGTRRVGLRSTSGLKGDSVVQAAALRAYDALVVAAALACSSGLAARRARSRCARRAAKEGALKRAPMYGSTHSRPDQASGTRNTS